MSRRLVDLCALMLLVLSVALVGAWLRSLFEQDAITLSPGPPVTILEGGKLVYLRQFTQNPVRARSSSRSRRRHRSNARGGSAARTAGVRCDTRTALRTSSSFGYDLRATPGRCPECGSVPMSAQPTVWQRRDAKLG